jgi:hypothetical protein
MGVMARVACRIAVLAVAICSVSCVAQAQLVHDGTLTGSEQLLGPFTSVASDGVTLVAGYRDSPAGGICARAYAMQPSKRGAADALDTSNAATPAPIANSRNTVTRYPAAYSTTKPCNTVAMTAEYKV